MSINLEKQFQKIGADVKVISAESNRARNAPTIALDIINIKGKELFEISIREGLAELMDLSVLEVKKEERHLVLLAKLMDNEGAIIEKSHFLCGHDERHFFVAAVNGVSTVAAAKDSLKPIAIRRKESGKLARKENRHKRKTELFKRQGEWFFVPEEIKPDKLKIRTYEPLTRDSASKPHIAQFAVRRGGESVMVCFKYPNGLPTERYNRLIASNPKAKRWNWRPMQRQAIVYVKGQIRHPDHATIQLDGWHRVLMNSESRSEKVVFLD